MDHYDLPGLWLLALVAPLVVMLPAADRAPRPVAGFLRRLDLAGEPAVRTLVRVLIGASLAVFAFALVQATTPRRTVAYVTVPITVAVVVSFAALLEDRRVGSVVRGIVAGGLVVILALHGLDGASSFRYTTIEDWSGAAALIEKTFPDDMPVAAVTRGELLAAYLERSGRQVGHLLGWTPLESGDMVLDDFDPSDKEIALREELLRAVPNLVELALPQRRGDHPPRAFPLLVAPPLDSHLRNVTVDGTAEPNLTDRQLRTGYTSPPQNQIRGTITMRMDVTEGTVARTLVIAVAPGTAPVHLVVRETLASGRQVKLRTSALWRSAGSESSLTITLGNRELASIEVVIGPSAGATKPFAPRELWVYSR